VSAQQGAPVCLPNRAHTQVRPYGDAPRRPKILTHTRIQQTIDARGGLAYDAPDRMCQRVGLSRGATATFSLNPVMPSLSGATTMLTITTGSSYGLYPLSTVGMGGGRTSSSLVLLILW
jgi:hypothetical protein